MLRFAWFLARAHLRRRRVQTILSAAGIGVGIAVLIVAEALTNGFSDDLISSTLQAVPDLSLIAYRWDQPSQALQHRLNRDPQVASWSPFLLDKGLLSHRASPGRPASVDFATVFGVARSEAKVLRLGRSAPLTALKRQGVVLGSALAAALNVLPGDSLLYLSSNQQRVRLTVQGEFTTGNYLIDSGYAFVRLPVLQKVTRRVLSGYQVRLRDPSRAPQQGAYLLDHSRHFYAEPWQSFNQVLLGQLTLQKKVIGLVISLIVIVASFGISNVLTLSVFERSGEIAMLRTLGAPGPQIVATFVLEGLILAIAGLLLGNLLGLATVGYLTIHPITIPGDLYFITALPARLQGQDLIWANAIGLTVSLLASYLPARRALGIDPAKLLR
jgi:lipoprotein-releasing system permease protein